MEHPTFRLRGERSYRVRHRGGVIFVVYLVFTDVRGRKLLICLSLEKIRVLLGKVDAIWNELLRMRFIIRMDYSKLNVGLKTLILRSLNITWMINTYYRMSQRKDLILKNF